ncbi:lipase [Nocardioides baekrokdamisoli]|uniref:Lipase n=1 Tax=Nocardioides baekrokdamisoli TaxID=1804624 RepID=A0A3G9IMJ1_9ACTN|nr:lipase family protein [Nocardioides baekrokdamisoli]BBH17225.1 lipase [Nocardioides baekrokdamisoli]
MRRTCLRLLLAVALAALTLAGLPQTAAQAASVVSPDSDPFYSYPTASLASKANGAILRTRQVTLSLGPASSGGAGIPAIPTTVPATQLLYKTTDATGKPTYSVTTVLVPLTGTANARVVSYQSFYDSLGKKCDPSYTLQGGDPGAANRQLSSVEQGVVQELWATGYVVNVPDFEDITNDWVAGTESGQSTLDSLKATESYLKLAASTPIALMGYSGGSIGSDWAAELAPAYAPSLNLIGTAIGGIPVNLQHNLKYVDGTPAWSDVMPAALVGIARSFHIDLTPYLSAYGLKLTGIVADQCIGDFSGAWPGLRASQLMKPQYADPFSVPLLRDTAAKLVMSTAPGNPKTPFFMMAGNHDGTGDDVMILSDQRWLQQQYCEAGLPVQFQEAPGAHTEVGLAFMAAAQTWLASRFAGVPAPQNCPPARARTYVGLTYGSDPLKVGASNRITFAAHPMSMVTGQLTIQITGPGINISRTVTLTPSMKGVYSVYVKPTARGSVAVKAFYHGSTTCQPSSVSAYRTAS